MIGRKIRKLISHMTTVLLFTILIIMLISVLSMKISGKDASLFGYQIKAVLSGSMEPEMETGSIIFVETVDESQSYAKNDIISFVTEEDMIVTHRIKQVRNSGERFVTKGDANDGTDINPVLRENIIGIYNGVSIPYIGYVMAFLSSREGTSLLSILPGVCLLIYAVVQFTKVFRINNIKPKQNEFD